MKNLDSSLSTFKESIELSLINKKLLR